MAGKYVLEENTFTTSTKAYADGGTVTVEQGAYLLVGSGTGIALDNATWSVQVDGMIRSQTAGVFFDGFTGGGGDPNPLKNQTLKVGSEGTIVSTTSIAVSMRTPADITNSGHIEGSSDGIYMGSMVFGGASKGITITNNAGGEIAGGVAISINDSGHALTVKNQGDISGNSTAIEWAGAAAITNSGMIDGDVRAINSGSTFAAAITNSGEIEGNVVLSAGDDVVKNSGTIFHALHLGNGENSVTNGGAIYDSVAFGTGSDTMVNTGSIGGDVIMGEGNNKFTNSGTVSGDVTFSFFDDVATNSKLIEGDVTLGDGDNKFTNSGTVAGQLIGGNDDDVVKNTGIIGSVNLFGGNDTYTGSNADEFVQDAAGNDAYKLGGGDDILRAVGTGQDVCDGGAGFDYVDFSGLAQAQSINLDSKLAQVHSFTLQASSYTSSAHSGSLKGFEQVLGSDQGDQIVGGSAAETIFANSGADLIVGGGGADKLSGMGGPDAFVYLSAKDSGPTRATRDTITDFENAGPSAGDFIDLGLFDADTKQTGNQSFDWIGMNKAFTLGVGHQLRAVYDGNDTIIQGDLNGDTKVDFSIQVTGIQTFTVDDFILIPF